MRKSAIKSSPNGWQSHSNFESTLNSFHPLQGNMKKHLEGSQQIKLCIIFHSIWAPLCRSLSRKEGRTRQAMYFTINLPFCVKNHVSWFSCLKVKMLRRQKDMRDKVHWKDNFKWKVTELSSQVYSEKFFEIKKFLNELVFDSTLPFTNQIIRGIHSHVIYFRSLSRMMDNPWKRRDRHETRN